MGIYSKIWILNTSKIDNPFACYFMRMMGGFFLCGVGDKGTGCVFEAGI